MNQLQSLNDKAVKKAIRENMVAMGYFNKPKVQVHKNKKAYRRTKFKRIDEL
jgi:hypothetical protein